MKTFKGLYIDTQGVIKYGLFPEEPDLIDIIDPVMREEALIENAHRKQRYKEAIQAAKDSAIEVQDHVQATKILLTQNGISSGVTSQEILRSGIRLPKDTIHPLPKGWTVEVKEDLIGSRVVKASGIPLDFYKQVAVLIPPPSSEQEEESQEDDYDVWTEFGNEVNKLLQPLNDPFGVHPVLVVIRQRKQFTITRRP